MSVSNLFDYIRFWQVAQLYLKSRHSWLRIQERFHFPWSHDSQRILFCFVTNIDNHACFLYYKIYICVLFQVSIQHCGKLYLKSLILSLITSFPFCWLIPFSGHGQFSTFAIEKHLLVRPWVPDSKQIEFGYPRPREHVRCHKYRCW